MLFHMITNNLLNVVIFSSFLELSEVIDQWPHTGREIQHTIYQLTQGDLA